MASAGYGGVGLSASTEELLIIAAAGAALLLHAEGKLGEALNLPGKLWGGVVDAGQQGGKAIQQATAKETTPVFVTQLLQASVPAAIANPISMTLTNKPAYSYEDWNAGMSRIGWNDITFTALGVK